MKNLNLICGDEEYLKTEKKKELLRALGAEGSPDFNSYTGKDTDFYEVTDLLETVPLFGGNRVIFLDSTGLFKGSCDEVILERLKNVPDFAFLIFCETETDGNNKLYKLLQSKGEVFRFTQADSVKNYREAAAVKGDIKVWIRDYLKAAGCTIDRDAVDALTDLSGFNMLNLETELEKLISYSGGRISRKHIDDICSKTVSDKVFDMMDMKLSGNTRGALLLFEDMLAIKIEPMRIIYMLSRQFNQVFLIKDMDSRRIPDPEILTRLGIKDWQLRKLRDKSRGSSLSDMRYLLELCVEMETKIKTGDITDRLACEIILCS